jgi:hypothetical protein
MPESSIAERDRLRPEARADRCNHDFDDFLLRPGRGRRALRRAAICFLRLLTRPPLRPFSRLARCLASLRTNPPSRPSATACGFFRRFFITPLHLSASSSVTIYTGPNHINHSNRFASLRQEQYSYQAEAYIPARLRRGRYSTGTLLGARKPVGYASERSATERVKRPAPLSWLEGRR